MQLTPMDDNLRNERAVEAGRVEELKSQGICPTCHHLKHGDVYPSAESRTIYEDDLVHCMLETWPRNPGHTIVLVKPHYEDFTEMPADLTAKVWPAIHAAASALKEVLGAEKVYLCTMCDGQRNHIHFQLIPRMPGDTITGSKLFVKDRNFLEDAGDVVMQLREVLQHWQRMA